MFIARSARPPLALLPSTRLTFFFTLCGPVMTPATHTARTIFSWSAGYMSFLPSWLGSFQRHDFSASIIASICPGHSRDVGRAYFRFFRLARSSASFRRKVALL